MAVLSLEIIVTLKAQIRSTVKIYNDKAYIGKTQKEAWYGQNMERFTGTWAETRKPCLVNGGDF